MKYHGLSLKPECALCGELTETLAHLHTVWRASRMAVDRIFSKSKDKSAVTILRTATPEDYIFRTATSIEDRLILLAFSLAVWRARANFYKRAFKPAFIDQASYSITHLFFSFVASLKKKGNYSSRDRSDDRVRFLQMLEALPTTAVRVFTDGSSYGKKNNPGPAGAGFMIFHPSRPTEQPTYHSEFLQNASNNEAELWVILLALRALSAHHVEDAKSFPNVQIFTDSMYAMNMILGEWIPRCNFELIAEAQTALQRLRACANVNILWVPGHAEVPENDMADLLAKRGARGVSSSDTPSLADIARHRANMHPSAVVSPPVHLQLLSVPPHAVVSASPLRRNARQRKRTNQSFKHNGIDYSCMS